MYNLNHPEKKQARGFDTPYRSDTFTEIVYSGGTVAHAAEKLDEFINSCHPEPSPYTLLFGEMHGHTNLSDAQPDIDTYFQVAENSAKLDFCAITDHDHGGVHSTELWGEKWDVIRQKVKEYHKPGKFTTLLAYERDSYPWYNNLVIYFKDPTAAFLRGKQPGCIDREELAALLAREDVLVVPHTTSFLDSGCDFDSIPASLMTPLIEVYSRWGTDEYFDNPNPVRIACRGGYWQDALKRGAKMGCICGSDDHQGTPGLIVLQATHLNLKYRFPGLTAVLAKENTREAIFEALKARRCYGLMGGRIQLDFRINGHFMGEEFSLRQLPEEQRECDVFFSVEADAPVRRVTVVKNSRDYMHFDGLPTQPCKLENQFIDYRHQNSTDYYYLRVELTDGRFAWCSPIWVET